MEKQDLELFQLFKEFITQLINTLTSKSLQLIKFFLKDLDKRIKLKKQKILLQFKNVQSLLNSVKQGKGKYPIHFVVAKGDIEIIKYLIQDIQIDYTPQDNQGNNPFFIAVHHQHLNVIKYFVEQLKFPCTITKSGNISPLHISCMNGNIQICKYFIQNGADIQKISHYGKPLDWAVSYNHANIVDLLLYNNVDPNGDISSNFPGSLLMSIEHCNEQIVLKLIEKGANVNVIDFNHYFPLYLAAQKGLINVIKALIQNHANPNQQKQGKTPLDIAFLNGHMQSVNFLRNITNKNISTHVIRPQYKKTQHINHQNISNNNKELALKLKQEGNNYVSQKNYAQAIKKYSQAIQLDSNQAIYYGNISFCYLNIGINKQSGQYNEALNFAKKCKTLNPQYIKGLFRQAQAYFKLQQYSEAASSYWQAWRLNPNDNFFKEKFEFAIKKAREK